MRSSSSDVLKNNANVRENCFPHPGGDTHTGKIFRSIASVYLSAPLTSRIVLPTHVPGYLRKKRAAGNQCRRYPANIRG
jgi:hypothetical protein